MDVIAVRPGRGRDSKGANLLRVGCWWSVGAVEERITRVSFRTRAMGGRSTRGPHGGGIRHGHADAVAARQRRRWFSHHWCRSPASVASASSFRHLLISIATHYPDIRHSRIGIWVVPVFLHFLSPELFRVLSLLAPSPEEQQGKDNDCDRDDRHDHCNGDLATTGDATVAAGRGT